MREDTGPGQQRLDKYEVAGVESDATHANNQRTANYVINTSVWSNRRESACEETASTGGLAHGSVSLLVKERSCRSHQRLTFTLIQLLFLFSTTGDTCERGEYSHAW